MWARLPSAACSGVSCLRTTQAQAAGTARRAPPTRRAPPRAGRGPPPGGGLTGQRHPAPAQLRKLVPPGQASVGRRAGPAGLGGGLRSRALGRRRRGQAPAQAPPVPSKGRRAAVLHRQTVAVPQPSPRKQGDPDQLPMQAHKRM